MPGLDFRPGDIRSQDLKSNRSLTLLTPHLSWLLALVWWWWSFSAFIEIIRQLSVVAGSCLTFLTRWLPTTVLTTLATGYWDSLVIKTNPTNIRLFRSLRPTCPSVPPSPSAGSSTPTARPGWRSSAGVEPRPEPAAPPPTSTTATPSRTGPSSTRCGRSRYDIWGKDKDLGVRTKKTNN